MKTNRYFSFSRFGLLLKHDLLENWKSYVRAFCIIFLGALVVYYMALRTYTIISIDHAHYGMINYIRYQCIIFALVYSFYMLVKAWDRLTQGKGREHIVCKRVFALLGLGKTQGREVAPNG